MSDVPAILQEMAAIEHDMRVDRHSYNQDEAKQSRYRHLVTLKTSILDGAGDGAGDGLPLLEIASQAQYERVHGSLSGYDQYLKLTRMAGDVLMSLPEGDRKAFHDDFEALPDAVAHACLEELCGHTIHAGQASADEIERVRKLPEGALLLAEWGGMAPTNLASVQARLWRVIDSLGEADADRFIDWHDGLSVGAKTAIYRRLAG